MEGYHFLGVLFRHFTAVVTATLQHLMHHCPITKITSMY